MTENLDRQYAVLVPKAGSSTYEIDAIYASALEARALEYARARHPFACVALATPSRWLKIGAEVRALDLTVVRDHPGRSVLLIGPSFYARENASATALARARSERV